ncbi:MAG: biotin--[acetyl-CoA-carboxylase] ligase [Dehalococcoidia bacterium]|nr:biotin--[acetyl-CoA-carboxylase] ligase [Dehalococcoidia bacterium]
MPAEKRGGSVAGRPLIAEELALNLGTDVIGKRVICLDKTNSTMEAARSEADAGVPEGTVVTAEQQTAGRGRFKRKWVSPKGENLLFSIILRPPLSQLSAVNMAATLALVKTVEKLTGLRAAVKWPNDVRIDGKKLAGILIEDSIESGAVRYAVIGIGLNVNMDVSRHSEIANIATSLLAATGKRFDRSLVLRTYLQELDRLYAAVKGGDPLFAPWKASLETLGKEIEVKWQDAIEVGVAVDVTIEGNLLLQRRDGSTINLVAGEVTFQK